MVVYPSTSWLASVIHASRSSDFSSNDSHTHKDAHTNRNILRFYNARTSADNKCISTGNITVSILS